MNTQKTGTKTFDRLQDFNMIYLASFELIKFPEVIDGNFIKRFDLKVQARNFLLGKKLVSNPELPFEVTEGFKFGKESVIKDGIVYKKVTFSENEEYVDAFQDITRSMNDAFELPEIKHTIKMLLGVTRRSVMTKDLLNLPGFRPINNELLGNVTLTLEELNHNDKVRIAKVVLTIEKDSVPVSIDLGIITYSIYGRRIQ